MKHAMISAGVAAVVSVVVWTVANEGADIVARDAAPPVAAPAALSGAAPAAAPRFTVTDLLVEDAWVDGQRAPGAENKPLAPVASSVCFLTKIEIKGIQSPADANACAITVDDFTGYWQVTATVGEGSQLQVRCNARCLVWE